MGQGHKNMVQGGRLDTMFQRDRRTERRSPGRQQRPRLCIASRGKTIMRWAMSFLR